MTFGLVVVGIILAAFVWAQLQWWGISDLIAGLNNAFRERRAERLAATARRELAERGSSRADQRRE